MMMRTFYISVVVLLTLINKIHGDDKAVYPIFPRQAEFIIESIIIDGQHPRTYVECIYDYDVNRLIIISGETFEQYNYATLKKAVYSRNSLKQCDVYPIDIDNSQDGFSAMRDPDYNTTHIRPLDEFLLLTSNATYIGESVLRGYIHVEQWMSSVSNDSDIIWSFAKSNYVMPWNPHGFAIPVQRLIKRKDDGIVLQILNIFSYKSMITRTDLTPPRGIFCADLIPSGELLSLQDNGMVFPNKFSVRIDASSTSQQLWHSVHFRYHLSNERKLIRYDYTPTDNTLSPITFILDMSDDVLRSYRIDRRTGSCVINDSVEIVLTTSILHNPIEALMKYENLLISNPPHRLFQYTGDRPCRGGISCTIYVGQMSLFPTDPEEDWLATNIEWGWSKRNMNENSTSYDYPVYLNLNLYRKTNGPPANVHYEFYDYRTDVHLNEFDVNLCYRSNQLWYQHLAFQLKITNQPTPDGIDNVAINRRRLAEHIRARMIDIMSIKYLRISQLEVDHHSKQSGHDDTLYCIFTLLDRTPFVDPNSEVEILDAYTKLETGINSGDFRFVTDDGLAIEAISGSLENVQYFYAFNPNASVNQIDYFVNTTVNVNRTIIETIDEIHEKIQYSDGAQAGAVIGGMIAGILFGILIAVGVIYTIKRKANTSSTGGMVFENIFYRSGNKRKQNHEESVTMQQLAQQAGESST